jgi:23S rRNA (adenine2503-C2)-methyltransferase
MSSSCDILSSSFDELSNIMGGTGKATIIWSLLKEGINPLESNETNSNMMNNLSMKAKDHLISLLNNNTLLPLDVMQETLSDCGTRKLLLKLKDGQSIESVLIPSIKHDRTTLCISTQVGCDRGCRFCLTGKMGLIRNLTSAEMIGQVIKGIEISKRYNMPSLKNVVLMGMGDSGRNIDNVGIAVNCLTDRKRLSLAQSKVTISTVGPSPETFMTLASFPGTLAWSLHTADDNLRKILVPSTKHTTIELREGLLKALESRTALRTRTIMIAITLINDINDSIEDAKKIADFVRPMLEIAPKIALDLIPYNDISVDGFTRPSKDKINAFQQYLRSQGFFCSVRVTRGDDDNSACGMLHTKRKEKLIV